MGTRTRGTREERLSSRRPSREWACRPCAAHPHTYVSTLHEGFVKSQERVSANPTAPASTGAAARVSKLRMDPATSQLSGAEKPGEHSGFPHFSEPFTKSF